MYLVYQQKLTNRLFTASRNIKFHTQSKLFKQNVNDKPLFDKILIANRGEIACRVIRTAKKLGIKTVAIYSEADANSLHVQLADEAYCIGPPEASKSYLNGERIIQIAKRSGAQAIHPGYGFLSENANFCNLCEESNIVFIGPPAKAIKAMGSKKESKELMEAAKVPVVPGYHGEDQSDETLLKMADKIGYPVLIKAVMGGGGKGMKIVEKREDFLEQLHSARREAINFFADDRVLIEKYLTRPRHVEIQVFADKYGNTVYLFERDCSVQRRHQKIIEEAPAPNLSEEIRTAMGKSAVDAAKAVGYVGAGTVEFIMDADTQEYYFMEMNTRLQVEHPVTEMITGQDLVEWQLKVASGHELPLRQDQIQQKGWSFEARIYSENPNEGFLPVTGKLQYLRPPEEVNGFVRVESGVRQGDEVSIYYDPMIAKLVVWGNNREEALRRLKNQLDEYHIVGLPTNIEFLKRVCMHPEFRKGEVDTNFIPKYKDELFTHQPIEDYVYVLAATALLQQQYQQNVAEIKKSEDPNSPWAFPFRTNYELHRQITLIDSDKQKKVLNVKFNTDYKSYTITTPRDDIYNNVFDVKAKYCTETNKLTAWINNQVHKATVVLLNNTITVFTGGSTYKFEFPTISFKNEQEAHGGSLVAPMPGKIIKVNVEVGDVVQKGQALVVMEAMKMEHTIRAAAQGKVKKIFHKVGETVEKGKLLVDVELTEKE